jgi:hypothetical protein
VNKCNNISFRLKFQILRIMSLYVQSAKRSQLNSSLIRKHCLLTSIRELLRLNRRKVPSNSMTSSKFLLTKSEHMALFQAHYSQLVYNRKENSKRIGSSYSKLLQVTYLKQSYQSRDHLVARSKSRMCQVVGWSSTPT